MSLGAGFEYLMSSVARGDGAAAASSPLTRYYAESGTPPGRWLGRGLAGLNNAKGLPAGAEVSEEALWRVLGMLSDPITGAPLGANAMSSSAGSARAVVAGFDLTFSVPKSVSVLWALADAPTQEAIYAAHRDAITAALAWAEENILFSRSGRGGAIQEEIRGVVVAAFDHWDSRAGDPHLHSHLVIANRVQLADGRWRALDSRTLHRYVVALSELHEGLLEDLLTERLGVAWTERARRHSPVSRHDLAGVPESLIELFSRRSADIEHVKNQLVVDFRSARGRQPTSREVLRLRQQATLMTRPDKTHRTLADQVEHWRDQAAELVRESPDDFARTVVGRGPQQAVRDAQLSDEILRPVAEIALRQTGDRRATFGHANVLAEVHRQLHGIAFASGRDRIAVADRINALALDVAVPLTPIETEPVPEGLRRADGTSKLRHRGAEQYTTQEVMDAETRLLDAARLLTGPAVAADQVDEPTDRESVGSKVRLSADQAANVHAIATSGRVLDLLVGPAGAGKTTSLMALRTTWEAAYGPGSVIGVAPSAGAAQVLADDLAIGTDNTAKWVIELARNAERREEIAGLDARLATSRNPGSVWARRLDTRRQALLTEIDRWSFHPGQLVILDEASLASTRELDNLADHVRGAGAKLLLVGDWAQLDGVNAGGAFALLTKDRPDAPTLREIHRFSQEWERDASTKMRVGDPDVVDIYEAQGRVHSASDRDATLDQLYAAWTSDTNRGLRSIMIAVDRDTVAALNARAQSERMENGTVGGAIIPIAGGVAAVGDRIVTRRNDRRLRYEVAHRPESILGWVKNGADWIITATRPDGAVTAQKANDAGVEVTLPADYVRDHVELGYATTAHRAQGSTVDTAHAMIDGRTTRQSLYVAATRAREANHLYVDTGDHTDPTTSHPYHAEQPTAREIVRAALARDGASTSAHAVQQAEARRDAVRRSLAEESVGLVSTPGNSATVDDDFAMSTKPPRSNTLRAI